MLTGVALSLIPPLHIYRCEDVPTLLKLWNHHSAKDSRAAGRACGTCHNDLCIHVLCFSSRPSSKFNAFGLDDELDSEFPELPEVPHYMPVFVQQVIPFEHSSTSVGADHDTSRRALLIASFGETREAHGLPACDLCEMACCFRPELTNPIELLAPSPTPLRLTPQGVQKGHSITDKIWEQQIIGEFSFLRDSPHRAVWDCGVSRQGIADLLRNWGPEIDAVMKKACSAIDKFIRHKREGMNKAVLLQNHEQLSEAGMEWPDEEMDSGKYDLNEVGVIRNFYVPSTQARIGFEVSVGMRTVLDTTFGELCTKLSLCDMQSPLNEVEHLCWCLDQILAAASGESPIVRYHRFRTGAGRGKLVRLEVTYDLDIVGRIVSSKSKIFSVTAREFDRELHENPAKVRPLLGLVGDGRRGQELIDSAGRDYAYYCFRNLQGTEKGRELVVKLAKAIEQVMGPIVGMAHALTASANMSRNGGASPPRPFARAASSESM